MTDGEKVRLVETWRLFCVASTKASPGSERWILFTGVSMALGWVLDEKVYSENFEELVRDVKGHGLKVFPSGEAAGEKG